MAAMGPRELEAFFAQEFPQMRHLDARIEEVRPRFLRMRIPKHERHLRPGGTIAGPTMMALADTVIWLCIIATTGGNVQSVTTNLNINFLRRPEPADLIAEGRLLKVGRRLSVGEVVIFSEGQEEPVAQASLTYAMPDQGGAEGGG